MKILVFIISITALSSNVISEIEYGYFVRPDDAQAPQYFWPTGQMITNESGVAYVGQGVQLGDGDRFIYLRTSNPSDSTAGVNIQFYGLTNRPSYIPQTKIYLPSSTDSIEHRTIVGPCAITPCGEIARFICYKIIRAENPIASSAGNMQVVVEQSTNLENWNAAVIMSHDSSTEDQIFFRTRIVPVPEE